MDRSYIRAALLSAVAVMIAAPALAQQAPSTNTAGPDATTAAPGATSPDPGPAFSSAAPAIDGDIVVTARQRRERLIDVPVAVTALGAQDIARYSANSLQDIAQMAPQVTIAKQASGSGSSFVIRGIGSSTLDSGFDQSVAINVDGVQNSRGRSLQQSYFDIAQVEILKGPQALFFGKNSPAGVISVVSANPTREFSVGGRVGYDFVAHEVQGEGYVSAPITSTLGVRLAVTGTRSRGWMKNEPRSLIEVEPATGLPLRPADKWGPKERNLMGRITVAWAPSDEFSANLKVAAGISKDNGEGTNGEVVYCGSGGNRVVDGSSGQVDPYSDCKKNRTVSSANLPSEVVAGMLDGNGGTAFSRYKPIISSLTMNWNPEKLKITSVTGYYQYKLDYFASNFAKNIFGGNFGSQREHYRQFSQEIRALTTFDSPLNFLVGAYFEDTRLNNQQGFRIADLPADPMTGYYYSIGKVGTITSRTYSAFGQATYKLAHNLELAGGVRWSRDQKDVAQQNTYVATLLQGLFPLGTPFNGRYKSDNYSPEATLTWHPTSRTTLYAAFKTGYKSGGFGVPALLTSGTSSSDYTFKPEKVKGGEIGAKGEFLDSRLTVSSAAYLYDYKGLQVDIFDGTKITYQIFNAGAARTYGVEADGRFAATKELSFRAALGYNHSRYRKYLSACFGGQTIAQRCDQRPDATDAFTRQDLAGAPTVRAPDWSGNIGASYDRAIGGDTKIGLSTDLSGSSKYFFSETEGPGTRQKGFVRLNAALRYYRDDGRWSVAFIGKNLFDKYVVTGGSDRPGSGGGTGTAAGVPADIIGYVDRPRTLMLQVSFKY